MLSITYRPPLPQVCSILFQFHTQGLPGFASIGWNRCGEESGLAGMVCPAREERRPNGATVQTGLRPPWFRGFLRTTSLTDTEAGLPAPAAAVISTVAE